MFKNVFKEIIIILLLLLAIVLVLGIFLYDYIPTSKIVPTVEPYQTPENIKQELKETVDENDIQTIVTYEIDETDLTNYEKVKDYNKGKANPFEATSTTQSNNVSNTTANNNDNSSNTTTNTNDNNKNDTTTNKTNPDSTGNYIKNTGTK